MQLSRIYSNRPDIFIPIDFNCGADSSVLNVVLGEVRNPKDRKTDSHNLGKSTLIYLIDFMLLKGYSGELFLFKHRDRFSDFTFYLEIALNSGGFATVRRSVSLPSKVALARHTLRVSESSDLFQEDWDHSELAIEDAVKLLDAWLDLRILKPYDYRKAITYFLRGQGDWSDELQLQKFQAGKDVHWKPFVAHLFGFDQEPLQRKYTLDEEIAKLRQRQTELQAEVRFSEDELPMVAARLSALQQHVDDTETQLNAFRFEPEEREMLGTLVRETERAISELNSKIYDYKYDLSQIELSLQHKDKFNLNEVKEIFEEAQIYFSDKLSKDYEDLLSFRRSITNERRVALRRRKRELEVLLDQAQSRKEALDTERGKKLEVLQSTNTFEKFKALQNDLTKQRAELVNLGLQREKLESVAETARSVREAERARSQAIDEIKAMVARPTPVYTRFQKTFNEYCQRVLNHDGIFYFSVNSSSNLDYHIQLGLAGQSGVGSSQGEGNSYKKLACALFDLSLLAVYQDAPFFHFVVHDGVLEGLDNRRKIEFLSLVHDLINQGRIQYIMTVITSDLPRDQVDRVLLFGETEIVLRLSDEGAAGRLFRMEEF